MWPRVRVIGIGSAGAGDDAVGLAVVERLRAELGGEQIEHVFATEASALVDLVTNVDVAIVIDAAVGLEPGAVEVLDGHVLAVDGGGATTKLRSTHGIAVADALALAKVLHATELAPRIRVVAIGIAAERARPGLELSPKAELGVRAACEKVRALLTGGEWRTSSDWR